MTDERAATRTRVGYVRTDDIDVYAGRGPDGRSIVAPYSGGERGWLGNPFVCEETTTGGRYDMDGYEREQSISMFREVFEYKLLIDSDFRAAVRELHGQTLGCFCQELHEPAPPCHAEVIAEWADRLALESDPLAEVEK